MFATYLSQRAFAEHQSLLHFSLFFYIYLSSTFAFAAPPLGQSALLNGMHDMESLSWMKTATSGCDKGWITDLRYIGTGGNPGVTCHTNATRAGISVIQRLDVGGSKSYPTTAHGTKGYAKNFAYYASKCSNIHVWIVGNEPNFTAHKSDPDCSSKGYARAYAAVHKAIHALPGHKNDTILMASNSPYSPGCIQSLRQIIKEIKSLGIRPDGFALHAYTQANSGGQLNAGYVTNTRLQQDNTRKECSGNAKWSDKWHWHFRIYIDYIRAIEAAGLSGRPIMITESGNACRPQKGNQCYPNKDIGYFQALWSEANRWNKLSTTRTKIRAITPYRWTRNDDGTGRDFAIGKRPKLLNDLKKAFGKKYQWTSSRCSGSNGCISDADCNTNQYCNTQTKKCEKKSVPPKQCKKNSDCKTNQKCNLANHKCVNIICKSQSDCPGKVCSPISCAIHAGQCLSKGEGKWKWLPSNPKPGDSVRVSFYHKKGWTWIGLFYCGPTQGKGQGLKIKGSASTIYEWSYTIPKVKAGSYRIHFTSDRGNNSIGNAQIIIKAPCKPKAELCNNVDDNCNGKINENLHRNCYSGPASTRRIGICKDGKQKCSQGKWQPCLGQKKPEKENCQDRLDNDCNGLINDNCSTNKDSGQEPERRKPSDKKVSPDKNTAPDKEASPDKNSDKNFVKDFDQKDLDNSMTEQKRSEVIQINPSNEKPPILRRGSGCSCETKGKGISFTLLSLIIILISLNLKRRTLKS